MLLKQQHSNEVEQLQATIAALKTENSSLKHKCQTYNQIEAQQTATEV